MPKLKATETGLDNIDELESADYEKYESTYKKYDGEIPPRDTLLNGKIRKMWYTFTQKDDPMLVVLFEADENTGSSKEYDGLPIWERLALTVPAKWKWAPFLDLIGVTIRDVRSKIVVEDEDDSIGAPITSIAGFEPDSEASWCRVLTTVENSKQYGKSAKVGEWLAWDEQTDEEVDEAADEPEEEAEVEVEVEPEEVGAEPEEEAPKTSARRGRSAGGSAAPAKPATEKPGRRPAQAATGARGSSKGAAPARRGARSAKPTVSSDDVPF